jgi:hypothetical protein
VRQTFRHKAIEQAALLLGHHRPGRHLLYHRLLTIGSPGRSRDSCPSPELAAIRPLTAFHQLRDFEVA